ncbi:MAG: N-6 DNA methylase [Acidimicrobiales bacterium]|nr:N-6 DNA methylase [Acidimicrobiales bacterium]
MRSGDTSELRKHRGAFFTPLPIADFLADWATSGDIASVVLDPTCGEAVFLAAAARRLQQRGRTTKQLRTQLRGYDLHGPSLEWAAKLLADTNADATLTQGDFFSVPAPGEGDPGLVDAIIGNPPFVRYQRHSGISRDNSKQAALAQGVRLSNLASAWAAMLVHSCGFLKRDGRLAMVLPAELLTVDYAEPVRAWLKARFEQVHLVLLEKPQFPDASEKVVLLLASGSGGCDAFSLYFLRDASDLQNVRPMSGQAATVASSGKWNALQLTNGQRSILERHTADRFERVANYGSPRLGSVTGANHFFTMTETDRIKRGLTENDRQVQKICPSQSKFTGGLHYTIDHWARSRDAGERVWLFRPDPDDSSQAVTEYVCSGEHDGVHEGYKCRSRDPWWRSPAVAAPDLFFTYMSHRNPRLIKNSANITMLNSMHGIRINADAPQITARALPLLFLNSLTLLTCEVSGRWYGNGVLKLEPREAGKLPVPSFDALEEVWRTLSPMTRKLHAMWRSPDPLRVVEAIDQLLLVDTLGIDVGDVKSLASGLVTLRNRRLAKQPQLESASKTPVLIDS